ncbi:MAG: 2OG-Fe(II) oxygenase [Myxococcota bacterium]|nr:2OG-Fe(II) oxygenase [Myxococcota bacterium]
MSTHSDVGLRLDPLSLMLSQRELNIEYTPLCSFFVDDYLPPAIYEELYSSYPDVHAGEYATNDEGKFGFRSSEVADAFERFCDQWPVWRDLVDFFASDAFAADTQAALDRGLVDARGTAGRKPWLNYTDRAASNNPLRYWRSEPMKTTFQISVLPPGKVVQPHRDAPRKLVSLMLYFADPDWRDEWGGSTEFYEALDPERASEWAATERVPFDALKPVRSVAFRPNRLAGFVRSDTSWHGVDPIRCPEGYGRKALLVNLKRLKWNKRHEP